MKVTIIGLGLIGGSFAIDLKKRGFASEIFGVDTNKLHTETAQRIGIIDKIESFESGIQKAELIILAVPVDIAVKLLPKILDRVTNQTVTDLSSTKSNLHKAVLNHPKRANYVAGHPMSGTENSGPWAAIPNLFDGKVGIICNKELSSDKALQTVEKMLETLNMRAIYMDAEEHDIHVAYVSHISHVSSFALALTVLEKEKNEKHIFDLASGGFRSTVRLAKSAADMWEPIFGQNSDNIVEVLDTYINQLNKFKELMQSQNKPELYKLIDDANKIRRVL